jgi:hypothetical protein
MKPHNYLYLLSEDDNDDVFYKACLEKIHNCEYEIIPTRIRKGGGISAVRQALTPFLSAIKNTGPVESMFFLVSVDNDRRSLHPEHLKRDDFHKLSKKEQSNPCRHCEIEQRIYSNLGSQPEEWPIPGAIAVPVEMLESWLLLICDQTKYGTETKLPVFSNKEKASAIKYYGGKNKVPNQLKDLVELERQSLGHSKREFYQHCASVLEPTDLARKSSSFAQFLNQVNHWVRDG